MRPFFRRFAWSLLWAGFCGLPRPGLAAIQEFSADLWKNPADIGALFTSNETRSIQVSGDTNAVALGEERIRTLNEGLARLVADGWRPDAFVPTEFKLGSRFFYDPKDPEALRSPGGSYTEVANYIGFLPDTVVVPIGEGETIPFWVAGLEAQIGAGANPNTSLFHFENPLLRLEALGKSWASLSAAQQAYVTGVCERMRPIEQLARRLGLRATLEQRRLRVFLASLEKEILEGRRDRSGPFLPLEVRGIVRKSDDGFDVSASNPERPEGIWIGKGESGIGIRPLGVSEDGRVAELEYLQIRWTLPAAGRSGLLAKPSADLVRKLQKENFTNLLLTGETELSFTEITARARRMDAWLSQAQAISGAATAPGADPGQAVEDIHRFMEENPEPRLVNDHVLEFFLTAETARQAILAR